MLKSDNNLKPTNFLDGLSNNNANKEKTQIKSMDDKDLFMKLFLTQLQHQDPTNPQDDREFLAQMAQFATLTTIREMNATTEKGNALNLVGKFISGYVKNPDNTMSEVVGIVEFVTIKESLVYVGVDGKEVLFSNINFVTTENMIDGTGGSSEIINLQSLSFNLIGKYVQALTFGADKKPNGFLEGKVESVEIDPVTKLPMITVGGVQIPYFNVLSVSDNMQIIGKPIEVDIKNGTNYDNFKGTINKINIKNGKQYIEIKLGDGTLKEVQIDDVNLLINSFKQIGKNIKFDNFQGKVESVKIKDGITNLQLSGNNLVSYEEFTLIGLSVNAEINTNGSISKVTGKIENIKKVGTKYEVIVDGKTFIVDKISDLTGSVKMIGTDIKFGKVSGKVSGLTLKDNKIYLNVGKELVSYEDYKNKPQT